MARTASVWTASAFERKPTLPELMPRIGHVHLGHRADRAQEGAVAAEDDQGVGRGQLGDEELARARLGVPRRRRR